MRSRIDFGLLGILAVSLVLNTYHLQWGLPNGNNTWAADAYGPITVLGVIQHSFGEWNSGWFYFKYPMGYPLLLAAVFSPYLALLWLTGGWRHPKAAYPYGFADPEQSLLILGLLGRALNVAFALGTVALAYGIARRLFDRRAGLLSAALVATAYPVVYYAHTTNLDIGYLFWLILALYCAIVASQTDRLLPWLGLGLATAMAVSTKEQGFAFLLPLPILSLVARARAHGSLRICWSPPALAMAGSAIGTMLLANNVLYNPLGFAARIAYLLGRPLQPVAARLAPVEFALWKGPKEWVYVRQLWDGIDSSLGTPLTCLAVLAAVAVWRQPRAAIWLLVPVVSHYYLSLRGLDLITLRYLLPVTVIAAILAAALLARAFAAAAPGALRTAVAVVALVLAGLGLARAVELDWLLRNDPRYQAEAWLGQQMPAGARGEVFQKAVYLPRFDPRWAVHQVPIEERSIEGLHARRPDFIVLSGASRQSITHIWNPDWRTTRQLLTPDPNAKQFLTELESGALGYTAAARLDEPAHLLRLRITSVAPEITIYVRND